MAGNIPVRHYKTSELISRFSRLAQTSQYYVWIQPNSIVDAKTKDPKTNKFDSGSIFTTEELGMYCNEALLPGNSFATTESNNDFPGVAQKFPYRKIYNDLQLSFYVDQNYEVIKFFEKWMSYIASPWGSGSAISEESGYGSFRFNYPDNYKCNIFISKFNKDKTFGGKIAYRFINAFPIDITSMPVSYDSSDILKCSVSFSYDRYVFDPTGKSIQTIVDNTNEQQIPENILDLGGAPVTLVPPNSETGATGTLAQLANQGIFGGQTPP